MQKKRKQKQYKIIEEQFCHALLILSASLRAGTNLPAALQQLSQSVSSPLREALLHILNDQRIGIDISTALHHFSDRLHSPTARMAIAMMQIAHSSGGPLAQALEKISQTMRNQRLTQDKIYALTAQGRLQGKILSFLPFFLLVVLQWLEPEAMHALWTTQIGWIMLCVIMGLEVLGLIFIQRFTRLDI